MGPEDLRRALAFLPPLDDPRVLVGADAFADAGIIRLREDLALVQTCDFFTPIVDDPFDFGQIAAANALGDLYAMGAEPLCALNIVCFPEHGVDFEILGRILQGGAAKVAEARAVILGGHSVRDEEIKYGLAVTGVAEPDAFLTNDGARSGDVLFLTKPLGTGILTTALKRQILEAGEIAQALEGMKRLNRGAAAAAKLAGAHAVTDVTGFGFAGHAWQMAEASGVLLEIVSRKLPFYNGAERWATKGVDTSGGKANAEFYGSRISLDPAVDPATRALLFDPQTSGGLLVAVPEQRGSAFTAAMAHAGEEAWEIGRVVGGGEPGLRVIGTENTPIHASRTKA